MRRCIAALLKLARATLTAPTGAFPVPAPATQELLKDVPLNYGGVEGESTTPTGAAILSATVTHFCPPKHFSPTKTGYGVGHKDFERPNVLRVALGKIEEIDETKTFTTTTATATQFKIEANIDDMPAEAFEPLLQSLFTAGAGDAWCTPIVMKKSRSATSLSVLADQSNVNALADIVLNQSTTIGLRILPFEKRILPRETLHIKTSYGDVTVKRVVQPNGLTRWKSEHDDVSRIAANCGEDYQSVKQSIDFQIEDYLRKQPKKDNT